VSPHIRSLPECLNSGFCWSEGWWRWWWQLVL